MKVQICNSSLGGPENYQYEFNPLNPELNPICYLLALLAHHFLHVSRIRVNIHGSVHRSMNQ